MNMFAEYVVFVLTSIAVEMGSAFETKVSLIALRHQTGQVAPEVFHAKPERMKANA